MAHNIDTVVNLLRELHWYDEPELVVKGIMDRPVFSRPSKESRIKTYKVVVGPLWTTYYDIRKDVIGEMDSIKTNNYVLVEKKIRELTNG